MSLTKQLDSLIIEAILLNKNDMVQSFRINRHTLYRDEEKEKSIKEIESLNHDKLKYEILVTDRDEIGFENINKVKEEIYKYGKN